MSRLRLGNLFVLKFLLIIFLQLRPSDCSSVKTSELVELDPGKEISSDEWFKEKKLVKLLLSQQTTSKLARPVDNHTDPVEVEFGINLIQVLRVNEEAGQLITNIWTHFKWCDPSLAWNNTAIGVDIVRVPAEEIWTPDVTLFNYADERMRQHRSTLAVVSSTGHVDWIPTGIYKSACSIDTFSFPFDEQVCYMTFRSLSMGVNMLTLKFVENREYMTQDSYVQNPEWEITENTAKRSIKVGKRGMKTSFYDLTFTLRLKRRSVFHRYLLLLPCVLLSLTAGVLFLLPPESPAKIQIGIFIFQGFFLLLNLLKNSTPPSGSRSPIIGLYYSTSMIATTVVIFACGYLVEIHFRADQKGPMSMRMRGVVLKLFARWLFIPIPAKSPLEIKREQRMARSALMATSESLTRSQNAIGARCATPLSNTNNDTINSNTKTSKEKFSQVARRRLSSWGAKLVAAGGTTSDFVEPEELTPTGILGDLIELRKMFQRVTEKRAAREYVELIKREWLIAIMVFDRIFFFIYVAYIIVSFYLLLPQDEAKY